MGSFQRKGNWKKGSLLWANMLISKFEHKGENLYPVTETLLPFSVYSLFLAVHFQVALHFCISSAQLPQRICLSALLHHTQCYQNHPSLVRLFINDSLIFLWFTVPFGHIQGLCEGEFMAWTCSWVKISNSE